MMEWLNKMNDAMRYIELNLTEKINYTEVARISCCSLTRFQRMFSFMTDITIGDYVRCRKMALAAEELKNSDIKIINIAHKYGYESPEAFTRAFQAFHKVPPTTARKLGISVDYQPISFQINITGGSITMGKNTLIRIEELKNIKVVSFSVNCDGPEAQAWYQVREWAVKHLHDFRVRRYIGFAPLGHHPTVATYYLASKRICNVRWLGFIFPSPPIHFILYSIECFSINNCFVIITYIVFW
jgi:AraC family transcriptional regulator